MKPRRFIVEVWDNISPEDAFHYCMKVAQGGLISETAGKKHHCHGTSFRNGGVVYVNINKGGSERFRVSRHNLIQPKHL